MSIQEDSIIQQNCYEGVLVTLTQFWGQKVTERHKGDPGRGFRQLGE